MSFLDIWSHIPCPCSDLSPTLSIVRSLPALEVLGLDVPSSAVVSEDFAPSESSVAALCLRLAYGNSCGPVRPYMV